MTLPDPAYMDELREALERMVRNDPRTEVMWTAGDAVRLLETAIELYEENVRLRKLVGGG